MVTILVASGLYGLGVPYVLPIGLWALAAASAFTFGQRVLAVRQAAAADTPKSDTPKSDTTGAAGAESAGDEG
jgi:CDP-diacylglycerol--glycerol-3-phosphate 3-phosphatidyltransferase